MLNNNVSRNYNFTFSLISVHLPISLYDLTSQNYFYVPASRSFISTSEENYQVIIDEYEKSTIELKKINDNLNKKLDNLKNALDNKYCKYEKTFDNLITSIDRIYSKANHIDD